MEKMRSCPFCGNDDSCSVKEGGLGRMHVVCDICGASGPWAKAFPVKRTVAEAIRNWNFRRNYRRVSK